MSKRVGVLLLFFTCASLLPASAYAHHEAMFGPQSAAVLSPTIFFSALLFDKETGKDTQQRRETTTVYSFGFTPLKNQPLAQLRAMVLAQGSAPCRASAAPGIASAVSLR